MNKLAEDLVAAASRAHTHWKIVENKSGRWEYGDACTPEIHKVNMSTFFPGGASGVGNVTCQQDVDARKGDWIGTLAALGWEPATRVYAKFEGTVIEPRVETECFSFRRRIK